MSIVTNRKLVTNKQLDMLLEYLEADHSFVINCTSSWAHDPTTKHAVRQKWERLATKLNAIGGANRNAFKWRDYWSEKKRTVRKKAMMQGVYHDTCKDSPKRKILSTAESRILSLIAIAVAAAKPELSVRIPFDGFCEDTPPAPISPTLPPMYEQDPPAGPSAPHHVQTPAASTSPEEMSPPLGEEPPQWTQEFEERLTAEELKEVSIDQLTEYTDLIKRATNMQIRSIDCIERELQQLKDTTGDRAKLIIAAIDKLAKGKKKKFPLNEEIITMTEQLKAGSKLLKVATEKYKAASVLQKASMKEMEDWTLQFCKDSEIAVNHIVKDIYRVAGAEYRKIDPMEQKIIKATERLKVAIERLNASNKPIESATLMFEEIVDISVDHILNGIDQFMKAFPELMESKLS